LKRNVESTAKPSKIYLEGDKFTFGKHKGRAVIEVLVTDPQYILWANKNISYINFKEETIARAEKKAKQKEEEYYKKQNRISFEDEPLTLNILGL
jgi:hypothetical protein